MSAPPETKTNKTIVYIDGQNFLHRCAESLRKSGALGRSEDLTRIDINYIFKRLFPRDNLEIKYFGVSKVRFRKDEDENLNHKIKQIIGDYRKIKNSLEKQNVTIRGVGKLKVRTAEPCAKCGHINRRIQEKGVDVGIAIEIIEDSMLKEADRIALVSSDTDMVPVLEAVNRMSVDTIYIGIKGGAAKRLVEKAKEIRIINNLTILEAYESALNMM